MPKVTFISHDGVETEVVVEAGMNLMQAAINNGVPGIDAECGGACCCATCHVHFAPDWSEKLPEAKKMEKDMLEFVVDPTDTSRLSCQLVMSDELDGIIIRTPQSQY